MTLFLREEIKLYLVFVQVQLTFHLLFRFTSYKDAFFLSFVASTDHRIHETETIASNWASLPTRRKNRVFTRAKETFNAGCCCAFCACTSRARLFLSSPVRRRVASLARCRKGRGKIAGWELTAFQGEPRMQWHRFSGERRRSRPAQHRNFSQFRAPVTSYNSHDFYGRRIDNNWRFPLTWWDDVNIPPFFARDESGWSLSFLIV